MCSVSQTDAPGARRTGFSLGSNCEDRLAFLVKTCDRLAQLFGDLRLSRVYETEPVNCPPGSPSFLNACVEVAATMPPQEILHHCQEIEKALGRVRTGVYGEARTCDIDLIYSGDLQIDTPRLTLPHPHAAQRRFVLQPLCDIDPSLVLPGQTSTVQELLNRLPESPAVTPLDLSCHDH